MTKVKICGLKEPEHVKVAVKASVDAIGFVFANSHRQISLQHAEQLAVLIPPTILKIGVFVNASKAELENTAKTLNLDYVQLHGEESPQFIQNLNIPTIKAFSIRTKEDIEKASKYDVDYYLFDAPGIDYQGGSGQIFNWNLLEDVQIPREKIILAGGLKVENVREAIQQVAPFMVDVSSGVEKEKRKDEHLMTTFVDAVRDRRDEK